MILVLGILTVSMLTMALIVFARAEMKKLIELDKQHQIHLMDANAKLELKRLTSI